MTSGDAAPAGCRYHYFVAYNLERGAGNVEVVLPEPPTDWSGAQAMTRAVVLAVRSRMPWLEFDDGDAVILGWQLLRVEEGRGED